MDFEVKDFSPRRLKVVIVSARSTVQAPALAPECRVAEEVDVKVPCDIGAGGHGRGSPSGSSRGQRSTRNASPPKARNEFPCAPRATTLSLPVDFQLSVSVAVVIHVALAAVSRSMRVLPCGSALEGLWWSYPVRGVPSRRSSADAERCAASSHA